MPTASMKTFDDTTPNSHFVATLRHGLKSCFAGASSLNLCFRGRAHNNVPTNDTVTVYNSNLTTSTFPIIHQSSIAPALTPTWTNGTTATVCIDLTAQMIGGFVGDMLQIRIQDATAVDYIRMTLN